MKSLLKVNLILGLIRFVIGAIAVGVGVWYLSSSIGGASLTYYSMDTFMNAIGAGHDIADANGCFLCGYIFELFSVIGDTTEMFWEKMLGGLWVLMAIGFGIYMFIYTARQIWSLVKETDTAKPQETKINVRAWAEGLWRPAVRILIVGAIMGAFGMGGADAMRLIGEIIIRPVMFIGGSLAMMATGAIGGTTCGAMTDVTTGGVIMSPLAGPFLCMIGTLNSVILAGAAGGFAMMNYAWLGLGGGAFTWLGGLALVIMFLIIGFDLFFQVLSVIFKLVFVIIFMPLILAATAFQNIWGVAAKVSGTAINMVISSAVRIVAISLKIIILFATLSYAADTYFPGPQDGYTAIFPPLLGEPDVTNPQAASVMNVFAECEQVGLSNGPEMDADLFKTCFLDRQAEVESQYPGAFDFMGDGWTFLFMMVGLFILYYFVIAPKVDSLLPAGQISLPIPGEDTSLKTSEQFDFGAWTHDLGKKIYSLPNKIAKGTAKRMGYDV